MNWVSIASLGIAFCSVIASVYFSTRHSWREDVNYVKKEAARDTEIHIKLDTLINSSDNTRIEISEMRKDINKLSLDNAAMSRDMKTLYNRVDKIEEQLIKLHGEFRNHVAHKEETYNV